jgi:hypothetical protein
MGLTLSVRPCDDGISVAVSGEVDVGTEGPLQQVLLWIMRERSARRQPEDRRSPPGRPGHGSRGSRRSAAEGRLRFPQPGPHIPRQTRVLELRISTARADGLLLPAYDGLARSAAEECGLRCRESPVQQLVSAHCESGRWDQGMPGRRASAGPAGTGPPGPGRADTGAGRRVEKHVLGYRPSRNGQRAQDHAGRGSGSGWSPAGAGRRAGPAARPRIPGTAVPRHRPRPRAGVLGSATPARRRPG